MDSSQWSAAQDVATEVDCNSQTQEIKPLMQKLIVIIAFLSKGINQCLVPNI